MLADADAAAAAWCVCQVGVVGVAPKAVPWMGKLCHEGI